MFPKVCLLWGKGVLKLAVWIVKESVNTMNNHFFYRYIDPFVIRECYPMSQLPICFKKQHPPIYSFPIAQHTPPVPAALFSCRPATC